MSAIVFDTLGYYKRLTDGGIPAEQAEAMTVALQEAMAQMIEVESERMDSHCLTLTRDRGKGRSAICNGFMALLLVQVVVLVIILAKLSH